MLLVSLGVIGGAVWLSRRPGRSRDGLSGLGDTLPDDSRGESLLELERAALTLYPEVDGLDPLDLVYGDDDYRVNCDFASNAENAMGMALLAREQNLPNSMSVFAAAAQAWSLAELQCPGSGPKWAEEAVEWPDPPAPPA
jgi:hypothetical protein